MTKAFWACAKCKAHGVLPRVEDVHNTDRWKKEVGHADCSDFQLIGEESPELAVKAILVALAISSGWHPQAPQVTNLHFRYCNRCRVYGVTDSVERSKVCCEEAVFLNLKYFDQAFALDTLLSVISGFEFQITL
ncbi:MAG: hypothetical protein AAB345_00770 [Patescibacteria group bacterium]